MNRAASILLLEEVKIDNHRIMTGAKKVDWRVVGSPLERSALPAHHFQDIIDNRLRNILRIANICISRRPIVDNGKANAAVMQDCLAIDKLL